MGTNDDRFGNNLSRRQFVMATGAVAVASLIPKETLGNGRAHRRLPILQNGAFEDRALVTVLATQELRFDISSGAGQVLESKLQLLPGKNRGLYHLRLSGLSTDEFSTLRICDAQNAILDERKVKGLRTELKKPRIAVMSCSSISHLRKQKEIWEQVPRVEPDLILFSGDIVYANTKLSSITREPEAPAKALDRYIQTWESVDLYQLETLVPLFAVWDDHDYGMNNGDSSNPHREEMQKIFRSFYPLPLDEGSLSQGPGVSFRAHLFGMDFYFLDNRSFAEEGRTVWGEQQEAWFAQDYAARPFPTGVVNGTCFFKHTRWIESVEKFAEPSLNRLKQVLRQKGKPCILFSGDIHASQVQKIDAAVFGFPTFEMTSSAVHSVDAHFVHRRGHKDGQIFYEGRQNFMCFEADVSPQSLELRVTCITPDRWREVDETLTIPAV